MSLCGIFIVFVIVLLVMLVLLFELELWINLKSIVLLYVSELEFKAFGGLG